MRVPSSASPAQTSAVTTQAIPMSSAARWPCCTPSAIFMSPLTSAVLCTRAATATVPAMLATTRAARAGQRLGVSTRNAIAPTAAATNAPRDEARYITAARTGSGSAATALATRERREVMIASRSG